MRTLANNYYNRGVRTGYAGGVNYRRSPTTQNYYNAGVLVAYGNMREAKAQLGDLFNDIMGAVVPGWDQRPDALKQIVIKPDPAKLIQMARDVAPNAAGQIVQAANANGLRVFYNTPAGQVPVTPQTAQSLYAGYPMFAQASSALGNIPTWAWIAGAGGLFALIILTRR